MPQFEWDRFLHPLCAAHKKADPRADDGAEDGEDVASRVTVMCSSFQFRALIDCKDKGFGFTLFLQAFPSYALAAAVTKQLDYADAMQHFSNCMSIANSTKAERRTTLLADIYDAKSRFVGVLTISLARVVWL